MIKIDEIINSIYISKELSSEIIYHFDEVEVKTININKDMFDKFYKRHKIHLHPCVLFDFFDTKGIKIAIFPVSNTEFWSGRIYTNNEIILMNDYTNRKEATIGALDRAIKIYKEKINF
jgi:hypothetical protein